MEKPITFELLFRLSQDGEEGVDFAEIIETLEMQGAKMTGAVRDLGVSLGILRA